MDSNAMAVPMHDPVTLVYSKTRFRFVLNTGDKIIVDGDEDQGWVPVESVDADALTAETTYPDGTTYDVQACWITAVMRENQVIYDQENLKVAVPLGNPWENTQVEPLAAWNANSKPYTKKEEPVAALDTPDDATKHIVPGSLVMFTDAGWDRPTMHSDVRRLGKTRMWIVLNYTKNSNRKDVNISPLNGQAEGVQGWDSGQYARIPRTSLRLLRLGSYSR